MVSKLVPHIQWYCDRCTRNIPDMSKYGGVVKQRQACFDCREEELKDIDYGVIMGRLGTGYRLYYIASDVCDVYLWARRRSMSPPIFIGQARDYESACTLAMKDDDERTGNNLPEIDLAPNL